MYKILILNHSVKPTEQMYPQNSPNVNNTRQCEYWGLGCILDHKSGRINHWTITAKL